MSSSPAFYYDEEAAERAVSFFAEILVHVKGELAGEPFILEEWQADRIIRPLFGWKRADGTRKYRRVFIMIPRKNGKSTLAAGIALFLLFCDGEPGAEIYSVAGDREQAAIVFGIAKTMFESSPALASRGSSFVRTITGPLASSYKVVSADAPRKHGFNASGIIFDELHVQPNRRLWDVLTTSTGSRRQPITIAITTAGTYDKTAICWEVYEYARRVRDGDVEDESFLPVIFEAEKDDDWTAPEVWEKANPNIGVSVKWEYLENECREAQEIPAKENTFRRLHLDQWTEQVTRWLTMEVWNACGDPVDLESLAGRECYGGLDLSATTDLSAFVLVFPPRAPELGGEDDIFDVVPYFWLPEDRRIGEFESFPQWIRGGFIEATPGNVIDHGLIRQRINELGELYAIREIAFDPWNATQISVELGEHDGFNLVQFRQGTLTYNEPTRLLERLLIQRRIRHGAQPVLAWNAANVAIRTDRGEYIRPDKDKSTDRIDGITALIMGLGRASIHEGSVYEERGVRTV